MFKKELCYGCHQKVSRMHRVIQKIAPIEKFVKCIVASIQQHCMDWLWGISFRIFHIFTLKKNQKKVESWRNFRKAEYVTRESERSNMVACASVIMDSQVTGVSVGPVKLVYKNSNKVISTHVLLLEVAFVIKSLADMMGGYGRNNNFSYFQDFECWMVIWPINQSSWRIESLCSWS